MYRVDSTIRCALLARVSPTFKPSAAPECETGRSRAPPRIGRLRGIAVFFNSIVQALYNCHGS